MIARLDDSIPPTGPQIERYFSIHRLAVRFGNWDFAGTESYVYSGVGRGFEPALANPFNIYALSWRNEKQDGNLGLGGEAFVRTERFGTFAGQLFIDDLQIDHSCNPNCKQPSSYALTLAAEGLPLTGDQRWFASYTRVSNLAYRNKTPSETYEIYGVGLARGFSDYDEIKAGLDLAVAPSHAAQALRRAPPPGRRELQRPVSLARRLRDDAGDVQRRSDGSDAAGAERRIKVAGLRGRRRCGSQSQYQRSTHRRSQSHRVRGSSQGCNRATVERLVLRSLAIIATALVKTGPRADDPGFGQPTRSKT